MAKSILKDEKRLLPACAYLNGEYGVKGYYLGVPAILGANGIERVVELTLDKTEKAALKVSIDAVTNLVADMGRLGY